MFRFGDFAIEGNGMARDFSDRHILKSPNSYAIAPEGGPKHACGSRFTRAATIAMW
jgi:hypothetical protein